MHDLNDIDLQEAPADHRPVHMQGLDFPVDLLNLSELPYMHHSTRACEFRLSSQSNEHLSLY